jgi:DNA-binding NtrC family response regulator
MSSDRPSTTIGIFGALPQEGWMRRLRVLHSPDGKAAGRFIVLESEPLLLGRDSVAARLLGLRDGSLSRRHARIAPQADAWTVTDLESRNGTFVDGERIDEARLTPECIVRLGGSILLYEEIRLGAADRFVPEREPLWGDSVELQRVRGEIEQVAPRDLSVLILGETGVGKEVVAAALHQASGRDGAFVPVNCGGLPRDLVESELFGHVAGAFTGADRARPGLFATADGGTIFLDEIGEMPLELQPKLLRVLSTGEVRQVGSSRASRVDVRVVAATHQHLDDRVADGSLRGDLYARLASWILVIPPLRRRRADILSLAPRLVPELSGYDADVAECLLLHPWPYNVRELTQVLSAAVIRAEGQSLLPAHLPTGMIAVVTDRTEGAVASLAPPLELLVRRDGTPSRDDLAAALRHHGGNVSKVAGFFGRDRVQVYRWLGRHELDPEDFRDD